ncbi:MAG: ABC transporter six-transmembrane domain-containing protein [Desulfobacterales bacterium]|nr:ABC transporter six-transmembrane domain-containing protein [Desulfobacterales bacterium]
MDRQITLNNLVKRFWKKTCFTWIFVLLEGMFLILIPLVIGWAVDDLLQNEIKGIIQLAALCFFLLIIGAGRRFYDTRIYSKIYRVVCSEMALREFRRKTSVSKISARTNLFTEFIEFLENSIPDIVNHLIGLLGTLIIIYFIEIKIFWLCISATFITGLIFFVSQSRMLKFYKGQNDEFENQVALISTKDTKKMKKHFKDLMLWNIRLSDLETINYSLTWIVLSTALIVSVFFAVSSGSTDVGHMITIVIYVFGFIESILTFPLYYQQMIRLHDIATRLG